jgi:hypothetical protein
MISQLDAISLALIAIQAPNAARSLPANAVPIWTASSGNPTAPCFAPSNAINVGHDLSLNSGSVDGGLSWAVSASDRGLDVAACVGGRDRADLSVTTIFVVGKEKPAPAVAEALASVTKKLIDRHPEIPAEVRDRYRQEANQLGRDISRQLTIMVREASRRHPGFLRAAPVINIPVS